MVKNHFRWNIFILCRRKILWCFSTTTCSWKNSLLCTYLCDICRHIFPVCKILFKIYGNALSKRTATHKSMNAFKSKDHNNVFHRGKRHCRGHRMVWEDWGMRYKACNLIAFTIITFEKELNIPWVFKEISRYYKTNPRWTLMLPAKNKGAYKLILIIDSSVSLSLPVIVLLQCLFSVQFIWNTVSARKCFSLCLFWTRRFIFTCKTQYHSFKWKN